MINKNNVISSNKYNNASHFSPTFQKSLKKYSQISQFCRMGILMAQARKKHTYVESIRLSNKPTIHENISRFFYNKQSNILNLLGDEKENYDDILDLDGDSEKHDKSTKDTLRKKHKYDFALEKPKVDLISLHKKRVQNNQQLQKSSSSSLISRYNNKFINNNSCHIIKECDLLPLILNQPGKKYSKKKIEEIKRNVNSQIINYISSTPDRILDEKVEKMVEKVFDKNEMKKSMETISLKYPLKSLNLKIYNIENKSISLRKKKRKLDVKRSEETQVIEKRYNFMNKSN
jgi:hypothetical protein